MTSSMGLGDVDAGFNRDRLLAVRVALAGRAYEQPEPRLAFIDAAAARLRSLPGVLSVAATSAVPVMDRDVPYAGVALEDGRTIAGARFGSIRFVDAGYIAAMAIPIRRGRSFTAAEARGLRDRAIVINDTMARRVWPEGDPVGQRLRLTADDMSMSTAGTRWLASWATWHSGSCRRRRRTRCTCRWRRRAR